MEGTYKMDEAIGQWKYYYRDGRLKSVEETKGEDNYIWEFYLPDSLHTQIISEGDGELVTYYTTGGVKEWYNYKNGLKDGAFEELVIENTDFVVRFGDPVEPAHIPHLLPLLFHVIHVRPGYKHHRSARV